MRRILVSLSSTLVAIMLACGVGALLILLFTDSDPVLAFWSLIQAAFGNTYGFTETLGKAIPLLLISLGLIIAFRCRIFNVGAEGQLYMGAIVAGWIGAFWHGLPGPLYLPLILLASVLCGAMWAAIPGILKAKARVNEIVTCLMLNYIAMHLAGFLAVGPLRDPEISGLGAQTPNIVPSAALPPLIAQTRLHAGVFLAIFLTFLSYLFMWKTGLGFRIRATGANPDASKHAGIGVSKNIVLVMAISGGLAGLAGMVEVLGIHHCLLIGMSANYGYLAILVALLGKLQIVGVVIASVMFAGLIVGGDGMQQFAMVPAALVYVIQGLTVLFVICADALLVRGAVTR